MKNIAYLTLMGFLLLGSCAPSRFVKPLDKGAQALSANIGGPMVDNGYPMPLPLSAITYANGIDSNFTAYVSLHLTSLLFGNLQVDAGATYQFYNAKNQFIPSISGSVNGNFMWDIEDSKTKFWPQLDVNGFWEYGKKGNYFYVGLSNWFELSKTRSYDQKSLATWIYNPQAGIVLHHKSWSYQIECKQLAPHFDNRYAFVPFYSFSNKGALGFYFSLIKTL